MTIRISSNVGVTPSKAETTCDSSERGRVGPAGQDQVDHRGGVSIRQHGRGRRGGIDDEVSSSQSNAWIIARIRGIHAVHFIRGSL